MAHKCGDLDFLENDGGIILLPGHPYILAVLTNGVKTNKDGREAIGRISQIIYEELSSQVVRRDAMKSELFTTINGVFKPKAEP